MRNLIKGIKRTVSRVFRKKDKKVYSQEVNKEKEVEVLNPRDMIKNLEETQKEKKEQEDIGKKVFEKTGRVGVGQSSTTNQHKESPKTGHGKRKYHKIYKP